MYSEVKEWCRKGTKGRLISRPSTIDGTVEAKYTATESFKQKPVKTFVKSLTGGIPAMLHGKTGYPIKCTISCVNVSSPEASVGNDRVQSFTQLDPNFHSYSLIITRVVPAIRLYDDIHLHAKRILGLPCLPIVTNGKPVSNIPLAVIPLQTISGVLDGCGTVNFARTRKYQLGRRRRQR